MRASIMFKNTRILPVHALIVSSILLFYDASLCGNQPIKDLIPPENLIVGGPCEYNEIPGVATIVSIKKADSSQTYCENTVEVLFNFVPDDPTVEYKLPTWEDTNQRLQMSGGDNPPLKWIQRYGIMEGNTYICIRSEISKGCCTPVIFEFPDLDTDRWGDYCGGRFQKGIVQ
jgi:hypothetical protein